MTAQELTRKIKEGWSERARQKRAKHIPRRSDAFYAGEFGGCQLRAYLRRLGFPETEPRPESAGRLADLADRGEYLEQSTLDSLSISEPRLHVERQKRGNRTYSAGSVSFECVGRLDGFIASDTGIECKSTGDEHYKELRSRDDLDVFRPSWVYQCRAYLWIFNLTRVFLVLINRDDHKFHTFEIKRDKKQEKGLLEELAKTEEKIQKTWWLHGENNPPNPKITLGCYHCPYHPYCPAFGGDETSSKEDLPSYSDSKVRPPSEQE